MIHYRPRSTGEASPGAPNWSEPESAARRSARGAREGQARGCHAALGLRLWTWHWFPGLTLVFTMNQGPERAGVCSRSHGQPLFQKEFSASGQAGRGSFAGPSAGCVSWAKDALPYQQWKAKKLVTFSPQVRENIAGHAWDAEGAPQIPSVLS